MANQRKSYRNVLATAAGAAVVASAMAPGAVAADDHTAADSFPDVAEDMTHYEAINALYQDEIIMGFEDGSYHPYESLTRIQAALMLERAKGLESDGEISYDFEDVPGGYESTVDAVYDAEYFQGSVDGDFDPYEELTREQMAVVLTKAYDLPVGEDVPESDFTDRGESALTQDYIDAVANAGVASGFPDGSFGVGEEIKRMDFAAMLYAAMNYDMDTEVTVADAGTVKDVLGVSWVVDIPLSNLDGATADSMVTLEVDGETIELMYDAEEDSFRNGEVEKSFDKQDLLDAVVMVETEDDDSDEPMDLGAVSDIEGSTTADLLGINKLVDLPLDSLDGATAESDVSIELEDGTTYDIEFDAENDSFRNAEIPSSVTVEALEAATVWVSN
ncbi:S-layer homology domain-containing protein [Salimicrobium halophilum]|uniref:S-layer homology domain-containing protein n=1 Tax=Salimicrobium halophilum TaxID=86666 RepID=A0A1G8SER6_9BACI|nr:S-layer homology domain-containing protein [Salimicrobium halophilum]SDJ27664.1 S-layer homology domain-containing protein [Salimicrobium halophilum]